MNRRGYFGWLVGLFSFGGTVKVSEKKKRYSPLTSSEIKRIKAEFESLYGGVTRSGKVFVMPPGSELVIQESRLRDLECRDGWSQLVEFIHGADFGVHKR